MDTVHAIAGVCEYTGAIHGEGYVLGDPLPGDAPDDSLRLFTAKHTRVPGAYTVAVFSAGGRPDGPANGQIYADSEPRPESRPVGAQLDLEIRAGTLLRHPRIAQTFDFNEAGASPHFVVLERLNGRSLKHVLRQDGMMSLPAVVDIVGQIVDALEAAHALNIFHGHLHPSMVRFTEAFPGKPVVTVLGFGWARLCGAVRAQAGSPVQSPEDAAYLAPEQKGAADLVAATAPDERSDQFSLATIAYEMLAGCLPFSEESADLGDSPTSRRWQPPPFADVVVGLPVALDEPFQRALSREPAERFTRLRDFVEAMRATIQTDRVDVLTPGEPQSSVSAPPANTPPEEQLTPLPRQGVAAAMPPGQEIKIETKIETRLADAATPPALGKTGFWAQGGLSWGLPGSDGIQVSSASSGLVAPASEGAEEPDGAHDGAHDGAPMGMMTSFGGPFEGEQQIAALSPSMPNLTLAARLPPYIHVLFAAAAIAVVVGAVSEMTNRRAPPPQAAAASIKPILHTELHSSAAAEPSVPASASGALQAPTATVAADPRRRTPPPSPPATIHTEAVLVSPDSHRDQASAPGEVRRSIQHRRKARRSAIVRKAPAAAASAGTFSR